jgi:hypothetical protein
MAGHPDLEDLAALADGRCQTAEAKRLRAHLTSCEECYEVFRDTLRLQEALAEDAADPVIPFPTSEKKRSTPWWVGAVAALLVVAVGLGLWRMLGTSPAVSVESLAAQVVGKVADPGRVAWSETKRGGEAGDEKARTDRLAFQAGVAVFNLQLALDSNAPEAADSAAAQVCTVLGIGREGNRRDAPLRSSQLDFADEAMVTFYGDLRGKLRDGTPRSFRRAAAQQAETLRTSGLEEVYFDLGAWAEAGRLAARARVPSLLQTRQASALLRDLKKEAQEGADLPDQVVQALEAIDRARAKTRLSEADYRHLTDAFEQILRYYYPVTQSFD